MWIFELWGCLDPDQQKCTSDISSLMLELLEKSTEIYTQIKRSLYTATNIFKASLLNVNLMFDMLDMGD